MSTRFTLVTLFTSTLLLSLLLPVYVAYGANYTPLVGLPGANPTPGQNLAQYFNKLYMLIVAIGAIIAFLKIAFAGAKWSLSEIVTDKSDAKKDIQGALLGLAILLIPFIVLNTIYSGLTNLNVLSNASQIKATPNRGNPLTDPNYDPSRPRAGEVVRDYSCITRVPTGNEGSSPGAEPETREERDCTAVTATCLALPEARVVVAQGGGSIKCFFKEPRPPCTQGVDCTARPPDYNAVTEPINCASATNCTAARSECNGWRGSVVGEPVTSSGRTYINCRYIKNTDPNAGTGGNTDSSLGTAP